MDPPRTSLRTMQPPRPQCHQRCVVPHPPFDGLISSLHARVYSWIISHTHTHTHTYIHTHTCTKYAIVQHTQQYRHRHSSLRCTVVSLRMAVATSTRPFRTSACTRSLQPARGKCAHTLRFPHDDLSHSLTEDVLLRLVDQHPSFRKIYHLCNHHDIDRKKDQHLSSCITDT